MPTIRQYMSGASRFVIAHKITSAIVLIVIAGGGYWEYGRLTSTSGVTHYVLGTVATGTIVASVSESGQVSASDSVDIKPQVTGTITWVGVTAGQKVAAGQAIASIDATDAKQAIADAQKNLAADKLTFQKSAAQAPVDYQNDVNAVVTAKENLQDDYNNTFNDLTSTYLDLPNVVSGAQNTIYGYDFDPKKSQWNMDVLANLFTSQADVNTVKSFQTGAVSDYTTANTSYTASLLTYQQTTRTSSNAAVDALLSQSITMTTAVTQALQTELNFLGTVSDLAQTDGIHLPSAFSTIQSNARSSLSIANGDLSTLLADKKTLDTAKQTITNDQQTITLDQVGNPDGTNPISLQVSQNSIEKEEEDIASQEADLAKYTIVAPFSGTISAVDAKVGDSAGSAAVATIISTSQIATLSLNEVDAAKIKLGDKVTLTFDAIDGLSLAGTVAEIDTVGTVSQGVVSYDVQASFDTQDVRVKPGMTVNADIQTDVAQNTLTVPSGAVKTVGGTSVVMVFNPAIPEATVTAAGSTGVTSDAAPAAVPVTTGISDDTNVQILSGLSAGQQIVVSTKTGSTNTVSAAAAATTRTTGAAGATRIGGGGGGNATFIQRGL